MRDSDRFLALAIHSEAEAEAATLDNARKVAEQAAARWRALAGQAKRTEQERDRRALFQAIPRYPAD